MKVAVVCPYGLDYPGGVQDQSIRLVRWLGAAGHEAWLVAPGSGGPEGTRHIGASTRVRVNRSRAPLALDPRAIGAVHRAVADADVVHIHEPLIPVTALAALLAAGPPKVGTFHADPGAGVKRLYRLGSPVLRSWTSRLAVATAVSPVAALAVSSFIEARVVPNAIAVADFEIEAQRHPRRVVFIGRDEPRKGLDTLLDAWPMVRRWVPDAELVVIGAIRPSPLPGVSFRFRVGEEEKRRVLAESAILCAPNLGGESFGLVLAEGMAAGCAVVASALPAFAGVVGDAGVLIAAGDVWGLGEQLGRLLSDPVRVGELGIAARKRVARFDEAAAYPRYLAAYEEAMSGP